jgi:hypothetical protein
MRAIAVTVANGHMRRYILSQKSTVVSPQSAESPRLIDLDSQGSSLVKEQLSIFTKSVIHRVSMLFSDIKAWNPADTTFSRRSVLG